MPAPSLAGMWDDAKGEFEAMTGKSKPKESKGLKNAFGSHTGLSGSLKKFDQLYESAEANGNQDANDIKKGIKLASELRGQLGTYKKAESGYLQVLQKAIMGDIDNRTERDTKTAYERALKFLSKSLKAIEETADSRVGAIDQRFNAAEKDLSTKEKMLQNWKKNMTGAVARGAAAAARVKADPTAATYNAVFPKAARDITMQLVFARDVSGLRAEPEPILRAMNPWASQSGSAPAQVAAASTPAQVMASLAGFVTELKKASQLTLTV